MNVADTLMIAGMVAGGLAVAGLGFAMYAAGRGDSWHDGYAAGKVAGRNEGQQPQAQPAEPPTVDAAWRPVQPARRFAVVAEAETQRRLKGR